MVCPGCQMELAGVKELRLHLKMKPGHLQAKGLSGEEFARVVEREVQRQKHASYYSRSLEKNRERKKSNKRNWRNKKALEEGKYGPIFRYYHIWVMVV